MPRLPREYTSVNGVVEVQMSDVLPLFEKLLNVVHVLAPGAKICFNSSPADSAEAVQRWV